MRRVFYQESRWECREINLIDGKKRERRRFWAAKGMMVTDIYWKSELIVIYNLIELVLKIYHDVFAHLIRSFH